MQRANYEYRADKIGNERAYKAPDKGEGAGEGEGGEEGGREGALRHMFPRVDAAETALSEPVRRVSSLSLSPGLGQLFKN